MAKYGACVSWAVLLTVTVGLAGAGSGLAQAAAEAGAAEGAANSAGGAAKGAGGAIGSALGRIGAKVESSTSTATPAASAGANRTKPQGAASRSTHAIPASVPVGGNGAQSGTVRVMGPPPHIHFDVVSFKRCGGGASTNVDLPADGDYVADHCQPLSQMISFAYSDATTSNINLSGYPSWVGTDLYDFEANVAAEDTATWQRMGLNARRAAVRGLLNEELKLKTHEAGNSEVGGIVVDHIERPSED